MKIFSDDKQRLTQLRELVNSHREIPVSELKKTRFNQSIIDNIFVEDFDGDKTITNADYLICSNWLMQGKPQNIEKYNKNRGSAPKAVRLPATTLRPKDEYLPPHSTIQNLETQDSGPEQNTDWTGEGDVDERDGLVLAAYILMGKLETVGAYNLARLLYPKATTLPSLLTANYTCDDQDCCDDDYDGDGVLSSADAIIYYSWSSLIDWSAKPSDGTTDIQWFELMSPSGFKLSPTKFPEMPCGDFDEDGELTSRDALIYYAVTSLIDWNAKPASTTMADWYEQKAPPGYRFSMNHPPICVQPPASPTVTKVVDLSCVGSDEVCFGQDSDIGWTDFLIFYKWFVENRCESLECYNLVRGDYPEACRLPIWLYEQIGAGVAQFEGVLTGEENL